MANSVVGNGRVHQENVSQRSRNDKNKKGNYENVFN